MRVASTGIVNAQPRTGHRHASVVVSLCARLVREHTEAAQALAASEAERDEERRQAQASVREALTRKVCSGVISLTAQQA